MKEFTFVIMSLAGGGAEHVCVSIANGLTKRGWKVSLIVVTLKDAVYLGDINENVKIYDLNADHARYAILRLYLHLRKHRPANILVFDYQNAVLLTIIRKYTSINFRLYARNINTFSQIFKHTRGFWKKFIVNKLILKYYKNIDFIINQSKGMQEDILKIFPDFSNRCTVIYNPIKSSIANYDDNGKYSELEGVEYLLCVGRLEEQKGFKYAIEAFSHLYNDYPNLRLKIVGEGSIRKKLEELAVFYCVSERVDFEGFQLDIKPYFIHARATVLTSLFEGFPNVLVESIALGTPIVSFDCESGPREIILNGVNGYLSPYKDITILCDNLKKLLLKDIDRKIIKETSNKYQYSKIITEYDRCLSSLVN